MNIAMVVYSHYSRDARVRRYAEALVRKGNIVDLICLKENYTPKEKNIRLIMHRVPRLRLGKLWYPVEYILFFIYSFFQLSIRNNYQKYEIIHIHNMPEFLVFASLIPKLFGAKIILDMHDPMPELYMSKYHSDWDDSMVRLLKKLENISLDFADQIITANEEFKKIFLQRNPGVKNKITVILNCPDPKIFRIINRKLITDYRKDFTLFYMGTVEERFGLDLAIEAFPVLIKKIPNIRFLIIPKLEFEGEYIKSLRLKVKSDKLEKYIEFLNPMPLEEISQKLHEADAGIVLAKDSPFGQIIFPVKLLEFIQMRIPVIASYTKILGKYFNNKSLYFLKKNNPDEIIKAVKKVHRSIRLRNILTKNARQFLKKYNWPLEERKYLNLISSIDTF